ncbi:hypothetical protein KR018_011104 [Drosophila ironensis]|nr:hypothetical protein KR018_011104 [Drosophila ironensis]
MTRQDILDAEKMFQKYQYNAWLSERISLKRSLGDQRDPQCLRKSYNFEKKLTASIIIAHNQEHPQTLLRTLYSIQMQTDSHLLQEIILVSDGPSDNDLKEYISRNFPNVEQLQHSHQRGLICARLTGAKRATGNILVFLNGHMEVTKGWLSPLMAPIAEHSHVATQPFIDPIVTETFGFERVEDREEVRFNWKLERYWLPLDNKTAAKMPDDYQSLQLEGLTFAIDRNWFWELGGWDEDFRGDGGDVLEMSLKVWQCGGRILTVPCSRIGALYKRTESEAQGSPNINPDESIRRNFKRLVEVWFDEYKFNVYHHAPNVANVSPGSLIKQRNLRRRLHCKSFSWYKSQLAPARGVLLKSGSPMLAHGLIIPFRTPPLCLALQGDQPIFRKCNYTYPAYWTLTYRCQLKHGRMCLGADSHNKVKAFKCNRKRNDRHWLYNYQHRAFLTSDRQCLHIDFKEMRLLLRSCDSELIEQRWLYSNITDSSLDNVMATCLNI